jgi:hypothetical protein
MTEQNDRRNRSNFSEVGLALLDGPGREGKIAYTVYGDGNL